MLVNDYSNFDFLKEGFLLYGESMVVIVKPIWKFLVSKSVDLHKCRSIHHFQLATVPLWLLAPIAIKSPSRNKMVCLPILPLEYPHVGSIWLLIFGPLEITVSVRLSMCALPIRPDWIALYLENPFLPYLLALSWSSILDNVFSVPALNCPTRN